MKHRTGHLFLRGNVYWLQYRVEGRTIRQTLGTSDLDKAKEEQNKIMRPFMAADRADVLAMIQGKLSTAKTEAVSAHEKANPPLRIKDAWQKYTEAPERPDSGEQTLHQYCGHWDRFEKWTGKRHASMVLLRDVTAAVAGEYASDLVRAGLSSNRFNKHISFLRLLFRVLADPARILVNPFAKVQRKKLRTHSRRELTIEELGAILRRADGDLATLLLLGASTGLRLGDCATLTWGEVDLARGIIRRIPNKTARSGKPVLLGIVSALHERLEKVPTKARTGFVLPVMAGKYQRGSGMITNAVKAHFLECGIDVHAPGTGEQIERKEDGTPLRDEKTGKVSVEDTGKAAVVDVGFHSLRHTWVSLHAASGTPQSVIQDSVGHSNPAMTAHYTHVSEETARSVALSLPAFATAGAPAVVVPPPQADIRAEVRVLAETLNGKTWRAVREKLLSLTAAPAAVTVEDKQQVRMLPAEI